MLKLLRKEIEQIKKKLLSMGAAVEANVQMSVKTLDNNDSALARDIIENDKKINQMEVDIEEDCLKILALHQPVAIDLRFLIAVLKINNDLERIADQAANIAHQTIDLARMEKVEIHLDFDVMAKKSQAMLNKSLDALVNLDPHLAYEVCNSDDEVDELNRKAHSIIIEEIQKKPDWTAQLIFLLIVSRNLERIADLATNISEDVIYMIEGEIVRHRVEEYTPAAD